MPAVFGFLRQAHPQFGAVQRGAMPGGQYTLDLCGDQQAFPLGQGDLTGQPQSNGILMIRPGQPAVAQPGLIAQGPAPFAQGLLMFGAQFEPGVGKIAVARFSASIFK